MMNLNKILGLIVLINFFNSAYAAGCKDQIRLLLLEEGVIKYASALHKGQKRKFSNKPYITHPISVGKIVRRYTQDKEVYIAAILHDTLEDTNATYAQLLTRYEVRVANLVSEVTTNPHTRKNFSSKAEYLLYRMNKMSTDALLIKLADRLHNVSDLVRADEEFVTRYVAQTNYILTGLTLKRDDLNKAHKELIQMIFRSMSNSKKVIHAKKFAIDAYKGLYDDFFNEDFVQHSIRVAELLERAGADVETQMAAYLKNVADFGKIRNARERIDTQFGKNVRLILDEIHVSNEYLNKSEDFLSIEVQRPKWISSEARSIILATRLDHLRMLKQHKDAPYRQKYIDQVNAMLAGFAPIHSEMSPIEMILMNQVGKALESIQ